uniref:Uncharacterized protein n=1 Tax=Haptolina brevifila TaxID=156173 RepID=A0A7S2MDE3_9EUKA
MADRQRIGAQQVLSTPSPASDFERTHAALVRKLREHSQGSFALGSLNHVLHHEHALRPRDDPHVVDKKNRRKLIDPQHIADLGLLVGVNLEETAAVTVVLGNFLELRQHLLARPTPFGKHIDNDGDLGVEALLDRLIKLSCRHLRMLKLVCKRKAAKETKEFTFRTSPIVGAS